jgi:hypothetical protein
MFGPRDEMNQMEVGEDLVPEMSFDSMVPSSPFLPAPLGSGADDRVLSAVARGRALMSAFRLDEAEPLLRRALALGPTEKDVLLAMAELYRRRGTNPAAQLDLAFRVVRSHPENALAHKLFALAARALGLEPLAIGHLRRCLELDPMDGNARFHLGLTLLQFGHWDEGWKVYEHRPTQPTANGYVKPAPPGRAEWRGEDLRGRTLVLLGEDGHGDQIQNVRFARQILAARPRRLVLDVRPPLRRLFLHALRSLPGGEAVSVAGLEEAGDDVDYVLAFGSMGGRLRADADTLSAGGPYLFPAAEPPPRRPPELRIGIAWRGEPLLDSDLIRSIPLAVWEPLLALPQRIRWAALQHGDYSPEELVLIQNYRVDTPIGADFDYLATADVVAGLDLVISADTSVAHLAGALGRPVWLLNRASSEWRWGWKADRSHWYPTMTIFNQDALLDWQPVIAAVQTALGDRLADQAE